tara:strand:+ start:1148 stop:1420 length:273 start_codon:yes stop_codon:yes gene_type:complete
MLNLLPIISFCFLFNNNLNHKINNNYITVFKIKNEQCGEVVINKKYFNYATTFTSLKKGTCFENGYFNYLNSETINVPVLGLLRYNKFSK